MLNRSWVEIDLQTIRNNLKICRSSLPAGQKIMAVVKADAYGHGDSVISQVLQQEGIESFAVSNYEEAMNLRNAGIKGEILILGYTPVALAKDLYKNDITQTLLSEEYAAKLSKAGLPVKCHFAIDSGMNRIGLNADDPAACERIIRKYAAVFKLTGIFTHLCAADSDSLESESFTSLQIEKFRTAADCIRDLKLPDIHYMNSAGSLWHNDGLNTGSARLGIVLYGLKPDYSNKLPMGIKPALQWKSVISMIKEVPAGAKIGYGCSFETKFPMRIATIPTGYADGYSRALSNKGYVLVHGKKAFITGRVCMDQMMIDVTDIPEASFGDEVVLLGSSGDESFTADYMAQLAGTIGYETVCGISKRVPRKYINMSVNRHIWYAIE